MMRPGILRRRRMLLTGVLVLLAHLGVAAPAGSQTLEIGDPFEEYLRILQLSGRAEAASFTVRPFWGGPKGPRLLTDGHPWSGSRNVIPEAPGGESVSFAVDPARLRLFANSRFPTGQNDGIAWQGRGLTSVLDFGATAGYRWLRVQLRPSVAFNQNSAFELAPVSDPALPAYAYPWRSIDWPQRFGPDAFWTLHPGQSEVRLALRGATIGVSTANLVWGPAIRNPIVMSHNAPGFPHVFIGTDGPVDVAVGDLEARWIWGGLEQSDWFDPALEDTDRFVTGLVATYSPSFVEGLSLGLTRVFYGWVPDGGVPFGDYFAAFQGLRKRSLATPQNPTGDDEYDQMLSLFARWVLAESGFEAYVEWARNDHAWDLRDFLLEPEHSQGQTIGLQKAFQLADDRVLAVRTELTHLERSTTAQARATPTYYAHHIVSQGYTHRGQIIGAGIGPGGNAQHLGADLYAPWGRAGAYLQRDVHDNDAYWVWAEANNQTFCCHDVSYRLGLEGLYFLGDFDIGAGAVATREFNRYFFGLDLWNLNLSFSATWRPR